MKPWQKLSYLGQAVSPESEVCTPGLHYSTGPGTAVLSHLPSVLLHLLTHNHLHFMSYLTVWGGSQL